MLRLDCIGLHCELIGEAIVKQLIQLNSLYLQDTWNDRVHELMNNSEYRLVNITTDYTPSVGTFYRAWFERTIPEVMPMPPAQKFGIA